MASERLDRITATLRADVERKLIPGAVLAIARGGRIGYAEAFGWRDREAGAEMTADAVFRVASMTKPMTSVAAMMLAEEGHLEIAAPVAQYLPEFAELTVGVERRKAERTMTVQDLLRHTSGLTYAAFGDSPVQMIWRDEKLMDEAQTDAELVAKLARLPLMFEPARPGNTMSTDVLGASLRWPRARARRSSPGARGPLGSGHRLRRHRRGQRASRRAAVRPGHRQAADARVSARPLASGGGGLPAPPITCVSANAAEWWQVDGVRILAPKRSAWRRPSAAGCQ